MSEKVFTCAGLPKHPCSAQFLESLAFVPSRNHFPAKFDREELEKNARCDDCARRSEKVLHEKLIPFRYAVALADAIDEERARRKGRRNRMDFGTLIQNQKREELSADHRRLLRKIDRAIRRDASNFRYQKARAAVAPPVATA